MTFEKEYNGTIITFSSDIERLEELGEDEPFVLLINNENRFDDTSFARYAIDIEKFDPMAYDDDGKYVEEEGSMLSKEEILEIANDEYCRMLIARFKGEPVLITNNDRLKVRELSVEDTQALMNLYNNVKPTFLQPFFETYDEAREYIGKYIDKVYGFYNYGIWGIYIDDGGEDKLIGLVGFTPREIGSIDRDGEDVNGYDYKVALELGYAVAEEYRRQGYGYEASTLAISYARKHIPSDGIFVNIAPDNIPAIGLAKKLNLFKDENK